MVSNRANIWQFKLCPLSHFCILCSAALHTLKHYAAVLREGKQETHSFLCKRKITFCLLFFFYKGQDYFIPSIWLLHLAPLFSPVLFGGGFKIQD